MSGARGLNGKVLSCLSERGPSTTGELAAALGEDKRRVQTALASLQTLERVRRTEEEGERVYPRGATPHRWEVTPG